LAQTGATRARKRCAGAPMGLIRLIAAPIRRLAASRLVQLGVVVALILLLENFSDNRAVLGQFADVLDKAVEGTVQLVSDHLVRLRTFSKSLLTDSVMIVYVYIICLVIFTVLRFAIRLLIDAAGLTNFMWLRNTIARERGIAAYRAWLPLERIRPADCPQQVWEEQFAWPKDNKPPYPPLHWRILREALAYVILIVLVAVLIQLFTPFPVLNWIGARI
jgi:hypothetical protein